MTNKLILFYTHSLCTYYEHQENRNKSNPAILLRHDGMIDYSYIVLIILVPLDLNLNQPFMLLCSIHHICPPLFTIELCIFVLTGIVLECPCELFGLNWYCFSWFAIIMTIGQRSNLLHYKAHFQRKTQLELDAFAHFYVIRSFIFLIK